MRVFPVIMCGGAGTRLWPASRPSRPKQFLGLLGGLSIFQDTVLRVVGLADAAPPVIVGSASHVEWIETQLGEIGVEATLILEPEGRDSAAAIAAAALWIAERDPEGIAAVVASDHHIPDAAAFQAAVNLAASATGEGHLVTLGVHPAGPSDAYGYIKPGPERHPLHDVERFVEKPDVAIAARYLAEGYLWNSGNLIARVAALIAELEVHAPLVLAAVRDALPAGRHTGGRILLTPAFLNAPKISMDYAVLDKTRRAAVLPVTFAWSDLGAWDAVWSASQQDSDGNAAVGPALFVDATGCLVRTGEETLVTLVGVSDLAVIVEEDAVLICDLKSSQSVKTVVDRLKADGRRQNGRSFEAPALASDEAARQLRRWFDTSALPLWWSLGADHVHGGFHEGLTQDGQPLEQPRRTRVQARQAYVYATAGLNGWAGPWRAAAEHALAFLLAHYERPDGLYRTKVTVTGASVDDTAWLYDQAFVLLALAAAVRAMPDRADLIARAARLKTALGPLRWPAGGFREAGTDAFQSNCHMHLFEAAMAMADAAPDDGWQGLAGEIVDFALTRFVDQETGRLIEFFDEAWRPRRSDGSAIVDPGHQFEWAWLLGQWARMAPDAGVEPVIQRLLASGRDGINGRGMLINQIGEAGQVIDGKARLWPQTERLRSAYLTPGNEPERRAAHAGLQRYLAMPIAGLWCDQIDAQGRTMTGPAPASSLYHILGAVYAPQSAAALTPR